MPIPAVPGPDFVFVQSSLLFGRFKAAFYIPALTCRFYQIRHRRIGWSQTQVIGKLAGLFNAPTKQRPLAKVAIGSCADLHRGPIVKPRTFCPVSNTQSEPVLRRDFLCDCVNRMGIYDKKGGSSSSSSPAISANAPARRSRSGVRSVLRSAQFCRESLLGKKSHMTWLRSNHS